MTFEEKYGPDTELRALSWKQPFGTLMLHGKIETRTWDTKYRGWVLICLSKIAYDDEAFENIAGHDQFVRIVNSLNGEYDYPKTELHTGGQAIAIGRLVDSRPMKGVDEDLCFVKYRPPWAHVSKKTGRKAWKRLWCHIYEDVQPINPVNWIGSQGWRTVLMTHKIQLL